MIEATLIKTWLTWREEWIFAGRVLRLLELIQFFIYVTLILWGLSSLRDEFVHEWWHGLAHGDASYLVGSLLRGIHYFLLFFLRKCTFGLKEILFLLLLVYLYRPFKLLHNVAEQISCTFWWFFLFNNWLLLAVFLLILLGLFWRFFYLRGALLLAGLDFHWGGLVWWRFWECTGLGVRGSTVVHVWVVIRVWTGVVEVCLCLFFFSLRRWSKGCFIGFILLLKSSRSGLPHKIVAPLAGLRTSLLKIIINLDIAPHRSHISRHHLLHQTQQNSLRVRVFDLNAKWLCKMRSIHTYVSVYFLAEDVESMLELEAFEELLDQVHAKWGCIDRQVLNGYFFSLGRRGCSYWKPVLFLPLLYSFSINYITPDLHHTHMFWVALACSWNSQNSAPHRISIPWVVWSTSLRYPLFVFIIIKRNRVNEFEE